MRINGINGLASKALDLVRLVSDYHDMWSRKDAHPKPSDETQAPPSGQLKQALHHPRRGSHWYSFNPLRTTQRRTPQSQTGKVGADVEAGVHGLNTSHSKTHNIVERIPSTIPGDGLLRPEKTNLKLLADTTIDQQQHPMSASAHAPLPNDGMSDIALLAKLAVNRRATFFLSLGRVWNISTWR